MGWDGGGGGGKEEVQALILHTACLGTCAILTWCDDYTKYRWG